MFFQVELISSILHCLVILHPQCSKLQHQHNAHIAHVNQCSSVNSTVYAIYIALIFDCSAVILYRRVFALCACIDMYGNFVRCCDHIHTYLEEFMDLLASPPGRLHAHI